MVKKKSKNKNTVKVKKKRTGSQNGKLARTKGHSYERFIAEAFRSVFPEAKRHLEYQVSEAQGVDLDNTGIFRIQCKRGRKYANIKAIEEVKIDAIEGGVPLLVTKGDNKESMVVIPLGDFLNIVKKLYCKRKA